MITQTQVLTDLNFLLGNNTIPSAVSDQETYIQRALERVYRAYNFPMNQLTVTVAMVNGVATLPVAIGQDGILDIRDASQNGGAWGSQQTYNLIDYKDQNEYESGSYVGYVLENNGQYTLYTSESSTSTILTVFGEAAVPLLNASISTPFPSSMCLAWGALKYYREAEDPYADLTPYEQNYQLELTEIIAAYNRNRPQKRGRTVSEVAGTYIGDDRSMPGVVSGEDSN